MSMRFRLLVPIFLALVPIAVMACSSMAPPPSDEEHFAKASSVFVAHVTKTEEVSLSPSGFPGPMPAVEGTFRVIEILKGQPPSDGKVHDLVFGPGNCSLGLFAGVDYLFFLYDDKFVLWPGGSRGFINLQGTEPKKLLEKLRNLKQQSRR